MSALKHHFKAWREQTTTLTQEDVAAFIDRDVSQVSRIEKGRDVNLTMLSALASSIGQKNPLHLLFPPGAPEIELMDLLWAASGKTPAQRRQALRVAKAVITGDDEAG